MKKIFLVFGLSIFLFACNNKEKEAADAKEQELQKLTVIKAYKDSIRLDSFKKAEVVKQEQVKKEKEAAVIAANQKQASNATYKASASSSTSYGGTQAKAKKKGWSDAAKGTAIGAVGGAVGGAIIDKKKGRGAIIGGVVGAGAGYLIGRGEDKKTGRAN